MAQTRSFATIGTSLRNALLSSTGPYQWNAPPSPSDPPYEMPSLLHWTLLKECLFFLHWTLPKECPPSSIGPSRRNALLSSLGFSLCMECPTLLSTWLLNILSGSVPTAFSLLKSFSTLWVLVREWLLLVVALYKSINTMQCNCFWYCPHPIV